MDLGKILINEKEEIILGTLGRDTLFQLQCHHIVSFSTSLNFRFQTKARFINTYKNNFHIFYTFRENHS